MDKSSYDFGMIGLGVMGRNFLLNMADHGFSVAGMNRSAGKVELLKQEASPEAKVDGTTDLKEFVGALKQPRCIMLLVKAGEAVDEMIERLLPLTDDGDIIIDGGNSHFTDTRRRITYLKEKNRHFMGMGVSGGEEGARRGPSIMPGGDKQAWERVKPMLEAVSAKVKGEPCVAYLGKDAAGHYVKMVHNGIEYAIMQMISETYLLMKRGLGLNNDELHEVYKKWNEGVLKSFLVEITRDIFLQEDDKTDHRLIDVILDKAGAKGTGKWTSQDAMDLHFPVPSIDISVSMRDLSSYKDLQEEAAKLYDTQDTPIEADKEAFISQLHDTLYFGVLMCYAQGMGMLRKASKDLEMDIPLSDVVKIWRGGCIIRSVLLDTYYNIYEKNPDMANLLLSEEVAPMVKENQASIRSVIAEAVKAGYAVPGLSSALSYFDGFRRDKSPVNLIQAQRDYFGSHTYERIDEEGSFHTEWDGSAK